MQSIPLKYGAFYSSFQSMKQQNVLKGFVYIKMDVSNRLLIKTTPLEKYHIQYEKKYYYYYHRGEVRNLVHFGGMKKTWSNIYFSKSSNSSKVCFHSCQLTITKIFLSNAQLRSKVSGFDSLQVYTIFSNLWKRKTRERSTQVSVEFIK